MLYSDEQVSYYPSYPGTNTDWFNVTVGSYNGNQKFTDTIKVLVESAFEDKLSTNAGDIIRMKMNDNSQYAYRTEVRGMINKMPGFQFTGYNTPINIFGNPSALISFDQYTKILDDFSELYPEALPYFYNQTSAYQWKDGIPK